MAGNTYTLEYTVHFIDINLKIQLSSLIEWIKLSSYLREKLFPYRQQTQNKRKTQTINEGSNIYPGHKTQAQSWEQGFQHLAT